MPTAKGVRFATTRRQRWQACLLLALITAPVPGCLDDLQAIGPGTRLTAPTPTTEIAPGEKGAVFAQVLDANGHGVDGAYVTFTRTDGLRIVWTDGPEGSDAVSVKTTSGEAFGIVGRGVARAPFRVPATAAPGEVSVIALLKGPADPVATIATRLVVSVLDRGNGEGGQGGGGGTDASGGMPPSEGGRPSGGGGEPDSAGGLPNGASGSPSTDTGSGGEAAAANGGTGS